MSRRLTAPVPVSPPKRRGKYDRWLDGALWELPAAELRTIAGTTDLRRARKRLADRCYARRLKLAALWLEDRTLAVQAVRRRQPAAVQRVTAVTEAREIA